MRKKKKNEWNFLLFGMRRKKRIFLYLFDWIENKIKRY